MKSRCVQAVPLALVLCATAQPASAQIFESVGVRAQGMGGAFVAVADDATATWWNPAGLATGPYFSGVVERGFAESRSDSTLGVAIALPSLGVSYYRLRISAPPSPSTEAASVSRQDQDASAPATYVVNEFGATVGQSVGEHVVLASTVRLVHAAETRADLDIGTIIKFGAARAALVVKHVHQPELTFEGARIGLDRQARAGVAYAPPAGPNFAVNAALDADLTTTATALGNARHVAGGAEVLMGRRIGLRTGVSVNTIDDRRSALSVGASAAVQNGVFIDARLTRGDDLIVRGWGFDLRVTF